MQLQCKIPTARWWTWARTSTASITDADVAACNYNPDATADDGSCQEFDQCEVWGDGTSCLGCVYETACNYDETATIDDGSCVFYCPAAWTYACNCDSEAQQENGTCQYLDECGICGGEGIAEGECDCDGNVLDALGECGGPCLADDDGDGVCDDLDDCVGAYDACGVCNGPGEVYECGCADIPEGDCDCFGNVLDECGVCGSEGLTGDICDCDGSLFDGGAGCAVATASQRAIAIASATNLTQLACAAAIVRRTWMPTASATTRTNTSAPTTNVVCATAQAPSTIAVVPTSRKGLRL